MYVDETKSKRDKHNFKYFKGGAIWILATGALLYRYASAVRPVDRASPYLQTSPVDRARPSNVLLEEGDNPVSEMLL
jgi:hypothetical protein